MIKRSFDIIAAIIGVVLTGWLIFVVWAFITVGTGKNGMFVQKRVGQFGKIFPIYKLRTIFGESESNAFFCRFGNFLRRTKIDELPQFLNVLKGDMSVVGPRPDIAGYYDLLTGDDREILKLKPGITGPASLKYFNEEAILAKVPDPKRYNDEVIFPDKVKINREYYENNSFFGDVKIVWNTLFK